MRSATKRDVTVAEIRSLLRDSLGPQAELAGCTEFTEGWFASVFGLTLADGRELVLKVAPGPDVTLMRYEFELIRTEIDFYRLAGAAGVPMPRLLAADPERGYLIVERLRGDLLRTVRSALDPARLAELRRELGRIAARLGTVTGSRFGYPRRDGRTRSSRWRTSFLAFIDDVLADAADFGTELPAAPETITRLVGRHAGLLDEVTTPALVHFDLWDSNVFVTPGGIEGIIDGERAFYGDPIAELVALAHFGDPADVPGLLTGFLGRSLTARERTRLRLYAVYLYLIMATEHVSRGFNPTEHEPYRRLALELLDAELAEL